MKPKDVIKVILIILFTIVVLVIAGIVYYQVFKWLLMVLFAASIFGVFILESKRK